MTVDEVFLTRLAGDFPPREGQLRMARGVERALAVQEHLVVEAPTGVGKSLAYLVPAIINARTRGRRAIVATANIALQEQLVQKDLPMLREKLGLHFTFDLYKGFSNYLCLREYGENYETPRTKDGEEDSRHMIVNWAAETETGDKAELPREPRLAVWNDFSTSSADCSAPKCKFLDGCFPKAAHRAAEGADILVTNYHALLTLLRYEIPIVDEFSVVILDEAHRLADIARDCFGFKLTRGMLYALCGKLTKCGIRTGELRDATSEFFGKLIPLSRRSDYRDKGMLWKTGLLPEAELGDLIDALEIVAERCAALRPKVDDETETKIMKGMGRAAEYGHQLEQLRDLENAAHVYYLEGGLTGDVSLASKPRSVAKELQRLLFDSKTTIATSATLATCGTFDYFLEETGMLDLAEPAFTVDSPFDWKSKAIFVVPSNAPSAKGNTPAFKTYMQHAIVETVKAAKGRTLGLFTSNASLSLAYDALLQARLPYTILRQGEGAAQRMKLVEQFKADKHSVLLGVASFFEGVDVPGEALSCVFIDKLPFPAGDPIQAALKDDGGWGWYNDYAVPRAVMTFRQGFGRLLRSIDDRGVIVALDERLVTNATLTKDLPDVQVFDELEMVQVFLDATDAEWLEAMKMAG